MIKIDNLIETLKLSKNSDSVSIYDFDLHAKRLFNSAVELGFDLPYQNSNIPEQILRLKNLIKNECQYCFKASVDFPKSTYPQLETKPKNLNEIFKLNIFFNRHNDIDTKISIYSRNLLKAWKARILTKSEFQVNKQDKHFKYKFYPRLDFSEYLNPNTDLDEVLWTNENDEICEGSFTNVFFQDQHNTWFTPSLDCNILPGITRELIIKELAVEEKIIYRNEVNNFKKIFLTNSLIGIQEVVID